GNTTSPDFPTTVCTIDSTNAGGNAYWGGDIFLVKFDSSGERLLYSTLIGGAGDEAHAKLALDNAACTRGVIIGANSDSPDFPTTADGFMPTNPGATTQHAFIRLKEELNVRIILPPDSCPKAGEAFVLSPEIDGCGHWTDFRKLEWSFGDGVVVWDTAPSHAYSGNGNYTVQVRKPGCSEVLDEQVLNLFALDLGPDLEICPGQDIILDASIAQASSYLWHDGLTTATHQVDKAGLLFVTATDARGCSASDTVKVNLLTQDNVQIPNIFTPNGDGINDKFFVTGLGDTAWHLQVFDRWGKLRLSDTAYQNDWQGDQLPEGVYYYILKSRLTCGTFIGHVTLMR
ncbi:MAG TPA: T9SS type B sorting domain-containing protein, partial [Bacteroidetes bacterium]|nr:T9SS type B sorting domain-containing protein [Bacteroidota bacterium]